MATTLKYVRLSLAGAHAQREPRRREIEALAIAAIVVVGAAIFDALLVDEVRGSTAGLLAARAWTSAVLLLALAAWAVWRDVSAVPNLRSAALVLLSFVSVLYAAWALTWVGGDRVWPALALLVLAWVVTWPAVAVAAAVRPLAGALVLVQNVAVSFAIASLTIAAR